MVHLFSFAFVIFYQLCNPLPDEAENSCNAINFVKKQKRNTCITLIANEIIRTCSLMVTSEIMPSKFQGKENCNNILALVESLRISQEEVETLKGSYTELSCSSSEAALRS